MSAPVWRRTRHLTYDETDAVLREKFGVLLSTRRLILTAAFQARLVTTPDGTAHIIYDGENPPGYVFKTRDNPLDLTRGLTV